MKSNRKKRILAAILCMVMVLTSNISALAEGEGLPDVVGQEQAASEAAVPVPEVSTENTAATQPQSPAPTTPETVPTETQGGASTTPETTPAATPDPTPEVTPAVTPEVSQPAPQEQGTTQTPGAGQEPAAGTTPETIQGTTPAAPETTVTPGAEGAGQQPTPGTTPETTPTVPETTPETTPEAEEKVLSEATELTQEFKDASGQVIQKITAKLPAGAFEAETSQITMEVRTLDRASENHIKNLMEKRLPQGDLLGDYMLYDIRFKVNGQEADSLQPITITFEKSGLEIKDVKKANVFYYDPADPAVAGDQDELIEITQRSEMIENLQASGQGTDKLEEYDLSSIEIKEENRSEKITLEGRNSTIYGCYVEYTPVLTLNFENEEVTVAVSADEAGIIPDDATLKVVPITAEDKATKAQYEEVEKQIQEKVAEEEKEVAGFLAYDISFVDAAGNEMEPNGKVKVSINYKKAELPKEVEEKKATDAEVTVYHLEENAQGDVKQVVDMAAEQKATINTLATTEGAKVQKIEVLTEGFSVFTITWTYGRNKQFTITAKYVDEDGKEITVEEQPEKIEIGENKTVNLADYWRDAQGYEPDKIRVDRFNGTVITSVRTSSITEWEMTTHYVKYIKENGREEDWLFALEGFLEQTEGTIYFVYKSSVGSSVEITDEIIDDGSLTAKISGDYESEIATYEWYTSSAQNGKYILVEKKNFRGGKTNISDDGTKLYPAFDDGAQKWYKVKITYEDGVSIESAPYQVPYFDSLQNGGFEKPKNGINYIQYSNEDYKQYGGVWQTTGTNNGKDIEIVNTDYQMSEYYHWYGRATDAEEGTGTVQFAELNCETSGALYQDVLTMEGQTLNYWLSHRARGNANTAEPEYDTMYLVIMPTKDAKDLKTQDQLAAKLRELNIKGYGTAYSKVEWERLYNENGIYVARITSDDQSWHSLVKEGIGQYVPTASLTRFFFMAGHTDSDLVGGKEGNFLDAVDFGQDIPEVEDGKFNLTLNKHFEGLGDADLTSIRDQIQFRISVKNNGETLSDEEVKKLLSIEDVVIKGSDMAEKANGDLTKSFVNCPITSSGNIYEITITEENVELDNYTVKSSHATTVKQNGAGQEPVTGDSVTATVSNIISKTDATIAFTNTYESTNKKNVNFKKIWDDKENAFGTRPGSLDVTLKASVSYEDEQGQMTTKELTEEDLGVETTKTLDANSKWETSWKVPVYYNLTLSGGEIRKLKINYTVVEGDISSDYVYEAGEVQNGTGEDYTYDDFADVTVTGDGEATTKQTKQATSLYTAKSQNLMSLSKENVNELGEPNHKKYITYNPSTGDYTLNLDVTGKKGEAKGVDVLFVIDTSGSTSSWSGNGLLAKVKSLLIKDNGIIDKILSNKNNSVAYVSFAGKNETKTSSWYTSQSKWRLKTQINGLSATGGTNWTYAMMKADEQLDKRANSGNEKVMIFLSDGQPTYSINDEGRQYGEGDDTRDKYYTEAIAKVTGSDSLALAQKYSVYLTKNTEDGMKKFAKGTGAELVDGTELDTALSGLLNKIIPTYEDVSITDTLSQYVEFSEGANPNITVYKDNHSLSQNQYDVYRDGKSITVSFKNELEDGATYRVSFRVKPSQAANEYYSENGKYPHTGDAGTGNTSAGQAGFYSNDNDNTKLTYSIKGTKDRNLTAKYQKPVVQITTHDLVFEKKWEAPNGAAIPEKVILNVVYTDGSKEQITLTSEDKWTVTKMNVPVTKKIQSVTEESVTDYTPSYHISEDGTKATVTNSYSKITTQKMTVKKIWSGNGPESEVAVSLYRSKNGSDGEKVESVVLNEDNGWTHTWKDLIDENWSEGEEYSYAVREEKIPANYTSNISYKTEGDTTTVIIENVYDTNCADENLYIANKLQTIPLTVTKNWEDAGNIQGLRPESLGVTVTEGNHELDFTLSAANNWKKTVKIPKRSDENYNAEEHLGEIVRVYQQTEKIVNATDNEVQISFTNKIRTTSITVKKEWVDNNPNNRPGSIVFELYKDGVFWENCTLTEEDTDGEHAWTKVIANLPIGGTYTVKEAQLVDEDGNVYDYNAKVTGTQETGFTITNTLNWHIIKTSKSLAGEETVNLKGAEFELKQEDKIIATGKSDEEGMIQWNEDSDFDLTSLNGTYHLVETKAPSGYVLHEQGWELAFDDGLLKSVTDKEDNKTIQATYDAIEGARVTVTNKKVYTLPSTGGTGIFVYTIGGTLLLMAAALLIYRMKREEVLKR